MRSGIEPVYKPVGATSHDLVRAARASWTGSDGKPPLMCHGGTLDPFADGLLLLLWGPTTQLMERLHDAPKAYEAEVVWGRETDTGDAGGQTTHEGETTGLTPAALADALAPHLGWQLQVPPSTSARKIGGEPAYRRVHRGESVELPPAHVYLHDARWIDHALPHRSRLRIVCRGGYYVRALARDLGRALGCGAHLSALTRTAIGPWQLPSETGSATLLRGAALHPWLPVRLLADHELGVLRRGGAIPSGQLQPRDWHPPAGYPLPQGVARAMHQGRLAALLEATPDGWRAQPMLRAPV